MKKSIEIILSILFIGTCIIYAISVASRNFIEEKNDKIKENISYINELNDNVQKKIYELNNQLSTLNKKEKTKIEEYNIWQSLQKELVEALSS